MQARMHDDRRMAKAVTEVCVVRDDQTEYLLRSMRAHDELAQHTRVELLEKVVVARGRASETPLERDIGIAGQPVERCMVFLGEHSQLQAAGLKARRELVLVRPVGVPLTAGLRLRRANGPAHSTGDRRLAPS